MTDTSNSTTQQQLRSFVERIERIDEEIKERNDDKRDIYAEARSFGLDVKALKAVIRLRAQDPGERAELDAIVRIYLTALGMTPDDQGEAVATAFPDASESPLTLEEAA